LEAQGRVTGIIDDRGKFVYITDQEMEKVAAFIKQRGITKKMFLANSYSLRNEIIEKKLLLGRVSIGEIVRETNKIINLSSNQKQD
jgi:hypothetical protein